MERQSNTQRRKGRLRPCVGLPRSGVIARIVAIDCFPNRKVVTNDRQSRVGAIQRDGPRPADSKSHCAANPARLLHGEAAPPRAIWHEDVHAVAAWDFGPMLAARHLWGELGLEAALDRLAAGRRRDLARLSDRALVLIANRLAAPSSEHGLARWLETDSCAIATAAA
jgi:hypothetical protein